MLPEDLELTPTTFVYGGDTLARLPDGRAVFIPQTIPGETVRISIEQEKERYSRARLENVVKASPLRIKPRCPHFGECGGCHYQHIPYQEQLKVKQAILIDQLERVGKLKDPPVFETVASPKEWNYRNHIQFHISDAGELGFLRHRSNQIIPIKECHLPEDSLNLVWPMLDLGEGSGLERVSLRSGENGEDALLVLSSPDPQPIEFSVDLPMSVIYQGPGGEIILSGDEFTVIPVKGIPFVVSSGSFFQVNTGVAELLIDALLEKVPLDQNDLVLDVYCGVGLFSRFIAPRVKELIGIESNPGAAEDFLYNLADFSNVTLYDVPAEDILPHLKVNPKIILLDPPRAGISRSVLDSVVSLMPEIIVYISCDPATLARDAARLEGKGYTLNESTPFDMFPQTYHIESFNVFRGADKQV